MHVASCYALYKACSPCWVMWMMADSYYRQRCMVTGKLKKWPRKQHECQLHLARAAEHHQHAWFRCSSFFQVLTFFLTSQCATRLGLCSLGDLQLLFCVHAFMHIDSSVLQMHPPPPGLKQLVVQETADGKFKDEFLWSCIPKLIVEKPEIPMCWYICGFWKKENLYFLALAEFTVSNVWTENSFVANWSAYGMEWNMYSNC